MSYQDLMENMENIDPYDLYLQEREEWQEEISKRDERINELEENISHYKKCDEARIAGLNACLLEGKTINDNPYKENGEDLYFEHWHMGFLEIWNDQSKSKRIEELSGQKDAEFERAEQYRSIAIKLQAALSIYANHSNWGMADSDRDLHCEMFTH